MLQTPATQGAHHQHTFTLLSTHLSTSLQLITVTVMLYWTYFVFIYFLHPLPTKHNECYAAFPGHRPMSIRNTCADPTQWDGCSHTFQPTSIMISVDSHSLHYALCTGTCMKLQLYLYWKLTFSCLIYSKACKFSSRYLISLTCCEHNGPYSAYLLN
jgi:hypothetical protein